MNYYFKRNYRQQIYLENNMLYLIIFKTFQLFGISLNLKSVKIQPIPKPISFDEALKSIFLDFENICELLPNIVTRPYT